MEEGYDPRLALIEAETRYRLLTADEPDKLEALFIEEREKVMNLKQQMEKDTRGADLRKKEMLGHLREAKFYQDKIDRLDQNKLQGDRETTERLKCELSAKSAELKRLQKCLGEFAGMEPTDADLERRIGELKASRLNLEMTFVGDSP